MTSFYLWIKALHIVAVIAWMAGLLYLPRLFVYHAEAPEGSEQAQTFVVMERRLMRFIMLPALVVVWASGLTLAIEAGFLQAGWLHWKLLLVLGMTGLHGYFSVLRKQLAAETNRHSSRFFRMINEAPTLLMLGIVVLVVIKPF
ncbi:protoporphyrinogen oxidase HemJ [Methylocapsa palsarum]|uniref:Protoporphyrinogen IX oxidase n=1 Tax=Methylocapsa palsarum TaxID=1612308 RepID=A0A1I3VXS0_9HYPH|nr:protoporphyrinogen oxidase HemJ [Methylocapsa palsarum]SFJ99026.1 putative membrane protein [Methylocapsa palsarum]